MLLEPYSERCEHEENPERKNPETRGLTANRMVYQQVAKRDMKITSQVNA